jgi:molybdate transport system permease protein
VDWFAPLTAVEQQAVIISLTVALRAVLIGLPLALAVAVLLSRVRFPGRLLVDAFTHLPLVLPPVVVGYLLLVLLGAQGPIGQWLDQMFGIRLAFTSTGASVAAAVMTFPLMVRAIRLSLDAVDPRLHAAARTLGARPMDRFFSLDLPLILPGIVSAAIVGFAAGLGEFGAIITFVANVPGETQTLPLAIYAALQQPGGELAAARLASLSIALALAGLLLSEWLNGKARQLTAAS